MVEEPRAYQQHLSRLSSIETVNPLSLSGIYCTIEETATGDDITHLAKNGMNVARLFFPNDDEDKNIDRIKFIRKTIEDYSKKLDYSYNLALAVDTFGAYDTKIKSRNVTETAGTPDPNAVAGAPAPSNEPVPIVLTAKQKIKIAYGKDPADKSSKDLLLVDFSELLKYIAKDSRIKFGPDILLNVESVSETDENAVCNVEKPGTIKESVDVTIMPNENLFKITRKDKNIIRLGVDMEADVIIASSILNAKSVEEVRKYTCGCNALVFSKIDNKFGIKNIDEIIKVSDGIVLHLIPEKIEVTPEKVPAIQKMIIARCNVAGKPVVCPVEYKKDLPDNITIPNIVNSVIDGSYSTSILPELAGSTVVATLAKTQLEAENSIWYSNISKDIARLQKDQVFSVMESIAVAAVRMAFTINAKCIIVFDNNEKIAHLISKYAPKCPIIAITRKPLIARQFNVYRGIIPLLYSQTAKPLWNKEVEAQYKYALTFKAFLKLETGPLIFLQPQNKDEKLADWINVWTDLDPKAKKKSGDAKTDTVGEPDKTSAATTAKKADGSKPPEGTATDSTAANTATTTTNTTAAAGTTTNTTAVAGTTTNTTAEAGTTTTTTAAAGTTATGTTPQSSN